MHTRTALEVLKEHRRDDMLVVTNQRSSREWPELSDHKLDFNYNPSAMGAAVPLALGFALARPELEVICISGDGSLLMNLGCLVTVCASGVNNLTILLFDNRVYEITGGQRLPAGARETDFSGFAKSAGFDNVWRCEEAETWRRIASELFLVQGPRFVTLRVTHERADYATAAKRTVEEQIERLRKQLVSGFPPL